MTNPHRQSNIRFYSAFAADNIRHNAYVFIPYYRLTEKLAERKYCRNNSAANAELYRSIGSIGLWNHNIKSINSDFCFFMEKIKHLFHYASDGAKHLSDSHFFTVFLFAAALFVYGIGIVFLDGRIIIGALFLFLFPVVVFFCLLFFWLWRNFWSTNVYKCAIISIWTMVIHPLT